MQEQEGPAKVDTVSGGEFLRNIRRESGKRQKDVALSSVEDSINTASLGKLERGDMMPSLQQVATLAYIHDVPLESVIEAYGIPTGQSEITPETAALGGMISALNEDHQKIVIATASQLSRELRARE